MVNATYAILGEMERPMIVTALAFLGMAALPAAIILIPSLRDAAVYVRPGSGFPPRIEYGAGSSRE